MAEEGDKVETKPVKDADPEPVKEVEPITSEPLKETKKKTKRVPAAKKEATTKTKNIKVIPVASELDHGLTPPEPKNSISEATPVEVKKEEEPEPQTSTSDSPRIPKGLSKVTPEEPTKEKKEVKVLELVKCDRCNRRMTEKTLKYSHEDKCPAKQPKPTTPVVMKTRSKKNIAIEEEVKQAPEPARKSAIELRHERIHNKQEAYKNLFANAF